jgi:hypothetical protein
MYFAKLPNIITPLYILWAFLAVVLYQVAQQLANESFYTMAKRFFKRLKRQKATILTEGIIKHRMEIREEIASRLGKGEHKDGIEVLLTDALRGGRTYDKNKRFLFSKKYHYQKVHVVGYYDKMFVVGVGTLRGVYYSENKKAWVETGGKNHDGSVSAATMGELYYDHVVKIDWEPSKSDNIPTVYYNYPFFKTFEREYFALHKGGLRYDELVASADVEI